MATLMRWLSQGFRVTRHMPGINSTGEQVPLPTAARALETAVLSSVTPLQAAPQAITLVHEANGPYHSWSTCLALTGGTVGGTPGTPETGGTTGTPGAVPRVVPHASTLAAELFPTVS